MPIYQTLNKLSDKYGSIVLLRLGSRRALVVSSRSVIEECLTKNDIIFANRPLLPSNRIEDNLTSLGVPYGDTWRNLRRFCVLEIFSSKRLQLSANDRNEEIRLMAKHLFKSSLEGIQKVDVKSLFYKLAFNIIMKIVSGKRCFEEEEMNTDIAKDKLGEFNQIFCPITPMAMVGDYFPVLRWLTFYGAEKKILETHAQRDAFLQTLLDEHRNTVSSLSVTGGQIGRNLIEVMLKLQESEPEFYTDNVIKGMMQAMLIAGPHTTVIAMVSAVLRLMSHPEVFKKARDEIDNYVGQARLIDDVDLAKLPYLYCIINETLRLDVVRLIPPHESSKECTVGGYHIPAGTQLLINVRAVHMDPELWTDPDKFIPERFQQNEEQKEGCKFIPFGSGRRQCPAAGLAMRLIALLLGTMIQCFEWENEEERPVNVIFRPRKSLTKVLTKL